MTSVPDRPPACRPAATVALIRDDRGRLEVFLQRRSAHLAFAPGMYVFPGGQVDAGDIDAAGALRWDPPLPSQPPFAAGAEIGIADPGHPDATAAQVPFGALVVAAIRETREECGVVLADPSAGLDHRVLVPFAHWLTPIVERRRFDTRFFVAALPAGASAAAATTESDHAVWAEPAAALAELRSGRMLMLPPTLSVLADLARYRDVAGVVRDPGRSTIRPVLPHPIAAAGKTRWALVDAYTGEELDPAQVPGLADWGGLPR